MISTHRVFFKFALPNTLSLKKTNSFNTMVNYILYGLNSFAFAKDVGNLKK